MEVHDFNVIYLAGGCFWGVEEYMRRIDGVIEATSGYANGKTINPTYKEVCSQETGHVETVKVIYDNAVVSLEKLLDKFFEVVNPTTLNKQGNDVGTQYRSGIYYLCMHDEEIVSEYLKNLQIQYSKPIVVELLPLDGFYRAEEYHQKYLIKNPTGYCHIDLSKANKG